MELKILNKPGVSEMVTWQEGKDAKPEKKSVVSVDFCIGTTEDDVFTPAVAPQRMRFAGGETWRQMEVSVKTRAKELAKSIPATEEVSFTL